MEISVISMVTTAVLVLSCLFLVLSPLFKWDSYIQFQAKQKDENVGKEVLYTTLNEIEFEYKMDKISESDYKKLKKQYEMQLTKIMKAEDEQPQEKAVDSSLLAEVEREIEATLKRNKSKEGES